MRKITCKNGQAYLEFGNTYSPFVLLNVEGIYSVNFSVNATENSMSDGATFIGSNAQLRNIILTIGDKDNHGENRRKLYEVFKPRQKSTFIYEEEDGDFKEKRVIEYYTESINNNGYGKGHRVTTISLICPEPMFSDNFDTNIAMTSWINKFEFMHEFKAEEFATKKKEKLVVIDNLSTVENIGMEISIKAEGKVSNPKVYHAESGEYIQVGTASKPLNMVYGDELIISTLKDNKNVWLIHDGVKTNVNEYIDEASNYIQLQSGSNTIRYFAENEDNLLVSIKFRQKYLGV